jgi:arylformamidase
MNKGITRRRLLKTAVVSAPLASSVAFISDGICQESGEDAGPLVWLDMDQSQLDAAYNQTVYAPNFESVLNRQANQNAAALDRLGEPEKHSYGESSDEYLLAYRTDKKNAPIHIYIHGGQWRLNAAEDTIVVAEPFVNAGANVVLLNFSNVTDDGVSLATLAQQVRDATAWVYTNAERIGGNRDQIFVSGHSSGGHLAGVLLVTNWIRDYQLPANVIKGGVCISGMFDLQPVRLSSRNSWLRLTGNEEQELSPQRHIENLTAPIIIAYGTRETPEFQRQSRDFVTAIQAAGKPVQLLVADEYNHFEILETHINPYGLIGHALLLQMGLIKS